MLWKSAQLRFDGVFFLQLVSIVKTSTPNFSHKHIRKFKWFFIGLDGVRRGAYMWMEAHVLHLTHSQFSLHGGKKQQMSKIKITHTPYCRGGKMYIYFSLWFLELNANTKLLYKLKPLLTLCDFEVAVCSKRCSTRRRFPSRIFHCLEHKFKRWPFCFLDKIQL